MNKKFFHSILNAIILSLGLISITVNLLSWQSRETYKIVAKRPNTNYQESDSQQFLLYKNNQVCYENDVTWSVNNHDGSKFINIDQNGLLTWQNLSYDIHNFEICARIDDQKNIRENITLNVGAIVGPTQLQGFYDQAGNSCQTYQLIDQYRNIVPDVKWDIQGHDINKNDIWFQNNKIVWSTNLKPQTYRFTIVAKKDNKSWQVDATLSIKNNYFIHGQTSFEVDKDFTSNEKFGSGSANYQLFQDDRLSEHQNFFWDVKDYDSKYGKKEIDIDQNGKLIWKNIDSDTQFRVVVISKNNSRELTSLIIRLHVKQYRYKIQGQTNFTCCLGDKGQGSFTFLINEQQVANKNIIWKLNVVEDENYQDQFSIDKNGVVAWTDLIPEQDFIFRIWTILKTEDRIVTSILCKLAVKNLYKVEYDRNKTKFDVATEIASNTQNFTFFLMREKIKFTDYTWSINHREIFSYDKNSGQIKWNKKIKNQTYKVELKFYVRKKWFCARASIVVNAIMGQIIGDDLIETSVDKNKHWGFNFHYSNVDHTQQINWTISDNLDGSLRIESNGTLHYDGNGNPGHYQITITAQHQDNKIWAKKNITLIIEDIFHIEGPKDLGSISMYTNNYYHGLPFILKNRKNQTVTNVEWKINGVPKGSMMINRDGKLYWQAGCLLANTSYNNVSVEAWTNGRYRANFFIRFKTIAVFEDAPWSVIASFGWNNLDNLLRHFNFKDRNRIIGKTKKIKLDKQNYEVRVSDVYHDTDETLKKQANLTFEFTELISDQKKQTILYPWATREDAGNFYGDSDLYKETTVQYAKKIEKENSFKILNTVHTLVFGYITNRNKEWNPQTIDRLSKCYIPSLYELTGKTSRSYPVKQGQQFAFYKNKTNYKKRGKNGDYLSYWTRSPSHWRHEKWVTAGRICNNGGIDGGCKISARLGLSLFFSV